MSTLEPLKVLIADDEAPARLRLAELLRDDPQVGTILEAGDGRQAARMIVECQPDLLLLDVQMPELTGLEVVDAVGPERLPLTIFVTAYDQHAIAAFQANALDYLLKPFSDERIRSALARAKLRLAERELGAFGESVMRMLGRDVDARPVAARPERIAVRSARSTRFVRVASIDWIESAGVHVVLHAAGAEFLHRVPIGELADLLDPQVFVRVHRSLIVNVDSIVQLEPLSHGEFEVVLRDGARRRVSRTYRALLEQRLGQTL